MKPSAGRRHGPAGFSYHVLAKGHNRRSLCIEGPGKQAAILLEAKACLHRPFAATQVPGSDATERVPPCLRPEAQPAHSPGCLTFPRASRLTPASASHFDVTVLDRSSGVWPGERPAPRHGESSPLGLRAIPDGRGPSPLLNDLGNARVLASRRPLLRREPVALVRAPPACRVLDHAGVIEGSLACLERLVAPDRAKPAEARARSPAGSGVYLRSVGRVARDVENTELRLRPPHRSPLLRPEHVELRS